MELVYTADLKSAAGTRLAGSNPAFPTRKVKIMKFYEVRQKTGSQWSHVAFLQKREDAEKYQSLFNTKVMISPTQVVEREFVDTKDLEDELGAL